jgi:hypothetical protein
MEAIPVAELADDVQPMADAHSTLGLAEMLLKEPARVNALTRDDTRQGELLPRFLALALISFSIYAVALALVLRAAPAEALPPFLAEPWSAGTLQPALALWAGYTLGMIAASGICLPSFYFFGLLSGVRVSVLQTVAHVLKGKGATSIMLVGLLPIYVAIALGMIVFKAPADTLQWSVYLGLALPFVAGLWGVRSIYQGFMALADTLPEEQRCRRACFLRRLTVAWSICYTAVTPVMIYTLWDFFTRKLA